MRPTLEQLKATTAEQLHNLWLQGDFPFEYAKCGQCLTSHVGVNCHPGITAQMNAMGHRANAIIPGDLKTYVVNFLKEHLEELYALRLFYDDLYPQSEPVGEREKEFVRAEEDFHDSRANTR